MAERAWDKPTAYALLDAASQWRILATPKELLQRERSVSFGTRNEAPRPAASPQSYLTGSRGIPALVLCWAAGGSSGWTYPFWFFYWLPR